MMIHAIIKVPLQLYYNLVGLQIFIMMSTDVLQYGPTCKPERRGWAAPVSSEVLPPAGQP